MAMTIDGSNGLTFPSGTTQANSAVGVGQSYSANLYGSTRAYGTTYTNSSSRAIYIYLSTSNSSGITFTTVINGVSMVSAANGAASSWFMSYIVPPSATYSISVSGGTPTYNYWHELS